MAENCKECGNSFPFPHYKSVQTIYERNMIPCNQRVNGMMVTVVGENRDYKQYLLKGADPCLNQNWVEVDLKNQILDSIGHDTVYENPTYNITSEYLNSRYPNSRQGFRVTFVKLNTTFTRLSQDNWGVTPNFIRILD